ncbi:MAG: hypothetical protein D6709_01855 [Chloroflexi bacterium]|uniref:DUF4129 domain-containing protein n=1 Tax=Candidatus Thermofonsia Clade 3 bacterium TaxID=2364212 RepID=A0A2M8QB02_9CHLR|nr:hypothetical protein [Candidatus Roseilinea sp. NK_OTU-006]PJF46993.1 MAG: hypothetical protein CUN48_11025 [Candidatus Thermofonsia Clade 3 bacterium]RMG65718.1 MAG: hypothetical protein D6709_01855 [Chloroflexota bacterium]
MTGCAATDGSTCCSLAGALRYLESAGLGKLLAVERAYALLTRYAGWLGIGERQQFTLYERADVLAQHAPQAQDAVQCLTALYVHHRLAPPAAEPHPADAAEAIGAWQQARRVLVREKFKR